MHRLLTVSIISLFALPYAFADNAPCHIPINLKDYDQKWGQVTCVHCQNMDDYANFGAANMVDNMDSYTKMTVVSISGRNSVDVIVATRSNPTWLNYGYGIFSINQRSYDRMNLDVSARLRSGRVSGRPWVNHTTPKSHMKNTCAVLAEEERKAAERMAYAEAMWERYGAAVQNNQGTGRGWRGADWARGTGSRIVPPDDCSNCRSEEIEIHRE